MTTQFISEIDVSGDGGILKQVISAGEGPSPPKGSSVDVHYVGTLLSDGSKFDSSRDRGSPFNFSLGLGHVIKGWDLGVATMQKGEKSNLICKAEYAYGESGSPPTIPPNSTLKFEVELLGWEDPEPDTTEEKLQVAEKFKVEGNKLFVGGDYESSSKKYTKALGFFDRLYGLDSEDQKKVDAIKLPCLLNLAASQIKLKQFSEARLNCHKALDIENQNVKALYRKGQAELGLGNIEEAKADLTEAVKLAPKTKEIRDELERAKKMEAEYKDKQKSMWSNLFKPKSETSQESSPQ